VRDVRHAARQARVSGERHVERHVEQHEDDGGDGRPPAVDVAPSGRDRVALAKPDGDLGARSPKAIVDEPITGTDSPNRIASELRPIANATTFTKPVAPHACSTR
jgi:hypothetical protein